MDNQIGQNRWRPGCQPSAMGVSPRGRIPGRTGILDQIAGEMGATRHYVRDRRAVILIARTIGVEKIVEPLDTSRHRCNGLQANGNAVVGESEFGVEKVRLPTEIALFAPHVIEHEQATLPV